MALSLALPSTALAHKENDTYLSLRVDPADSHRLFGQLEIALRDLDFAIGIDSDHNGAITWGEVKAHRGAIARYALDLHQGRWPRLSRHTDRCSRRTVVVSARAMYPSQALAF